MIHFGQGRTYQYATTCAALPRESDDAFLLRRQGIYTSSVEADDNGFCRANTTGTTDITGYSSEHRSLGWVNRLLRFRGAGRARWRKSRYQAKLRNLLPLEIMETTKYRHLRKNPASRSMKQPYVGFTGRYRTPATGCGCFAKQTKL